MRYEKMKVIVKSPALREETTNNGKVLHKQQVALDTGDSFPLPFYVTVPQGRPYPAGEYRLSASTFRTSRYGSLEVDPYGVRLEAIKEAKAA